MLFEKGSVKYLQIQTIDLCNSRCEFCPNRYRQQTGHIMEDEVFEKILKETKSFLVEDPQIVFHLENEPLLDKKLFKRMQLARSVFSNPETEIFMSSNGILAEKYKEEIINIPNLYNFMQYGKNYKTFNKFTKHNISKENFNKMVEINEEIISRINYLNHNTNQKKGAKKHIPNKSSRLVPGKNCLSRAGFLDGWKIKYKGDGGYCSKKEPWKYFNFLADGSMILCSMDYIKESVLGNIKYQTLNEILNSKRTHSIIKKARGEINSEENFICKRCKYFKNKHLRLESV
ncbi:MAG: SPASM domain-containing protein [Candidatus Woesearchaeota archaeon]